MTPSDSPPLEGIKILDLSRHLPGPLATLYLADMGAEVIKLEHPSSGDPLRQVPPLIDGTSAMFLELNRSKRSVAIDLKSHEGTDLALRLASTCDLVVEGFRPGVLKNLGLGYEKLKASRQDIILCSITGYGQNGPDMDTPGHDINYCARTGILARSGAADIPPQICGAQLADVAGGTWPALSAIVTALFHRERTGQGQWIDLALADGALSTMTLSLAPVLAGLPVPAKGQGPLDGGLACYCVYETKDGKHLAVGALEEQFFNALCKAMDLPHLQGQGMSQGKQGQKVREELSAKFASLTKAQWTEKLQGIPCCVEPVLDLDEVPNHPQFKARGMFVHMEKNKDIPVHLANPIKLQNTSSPIIKAPTLGQHTIEILQDLGIDRDMLQNLSEAGVIRTAKTK